MALERTVHTLGSSEAGTPVGTSAVQNQTTATPATIR
jgi:hypothetical protein